MLLDPFQSAEIKINRAKHHLDDLDRQVTSFFERGAVRIVFEHDDEMSAGVGWESSAFVYRQREKIPLEWGAAIGDVIHNLRASLDLMVSDIFRLTKGNPQDIGYVHFPFARDKDRLHEQIRARRLNRIGKKFIEAIEHIAPYKDGNRGLRAIHDLDVLDKHQALVPTVAIVEIDWPVSVTNSEKFVTSVAHDGQRIIMIPKALCPLDYGTTIKADFSIIFGEGSAFERTYLVKQLEASVTSIESILKLFKHVATEQGLIKNPDGISQEVVREIPTGNLNWGNAILKKDDTDVERRDRRRPAADDQISQS